MSSFKQNERILETWIEPDIRHPWWELVNLKKAVELGHVESEPIGSVLLGDIN